jgi:dienelactone hydrolase
MGEPSSGAPSGESLGLVVRPVEAGERLAGLRVRRLEFNSGGDRVPARLVLPPEGDDPHPLVLLQHGRRGSKSADYMDHAAGPWARGGAAVLSIDFPLHGERASAKLTEKVLASLGSADAAGQALWTDFVRRAVADLGRALDAAARLPELDAERTVYASFSMGSIVGGTFLGGDPRPRAAALALGGGGFGPAAVDPVRHLARFAPRPLLFVNASRDETVPRRATEALYEAAGEPKRIEWFDCTHSALPGRALKAMWEFLRGPLRLD